MFQKWKTILTNWINCYFNDGDKKILSVTLETLVDIISHLRENFSLDESKSSLLEAHTVHEFINEKYPNFKFENGTTAPVNVQDIYIAASLLLYFVCVNSKDVHIKSAMCKNLSVEDQEIILKFSKCLMKCPDISYDDVLAAIKDACTQDVPGTSSEHFTVSETPPALRSLHSEVRRLQAALDAERFDRNYLQDELSRTNLKLEKLGKDKEQYKLEILNLKAKISLCCGENKESKPSEPTAKNSTKLLKQLEETEERLVNIQEQMDDLQHERDSYKNKLEETKNQYDKLVVLSQQETLRADQLAEELETERHQSQSLRELVSELQQHNRLNVLDTSQLECDDIDVSIHSPQNNISVCSEACANVIEVQLGEERAKIIVLKGQIQDLEGKLTELNKKYDHEKLSFTNIVSQKDIEILSFKDQIHEEIEVKNAMKLHFDNEINKLNSDLSEMEQNLKETNESSKRVIESKIQEIQTLQEEKLSLIQRFNTETTKLEIVIKNLQGDIEAEKASKMKMREEYDSQIMLLNDKALNRNNELFELQDKIVENGEKLEILQMELKKEKDLKNDLANKHNNDIMNLSMHKEVLEKDLRQKSEELGEIQMQLKQYVDMNTELQRELDYLKNCYTKSQEECNIVCGHRDRLLSDIKNRDIKIEKSQQDLENFEKVYNEMKNKLTCTLNESQATISTLKSQLQDEINYKLSLQNRMSEMEKSVSEKDNKIIESELKLKEISEKILAEKCGLQETINKLRNDTTEKCEIIKTIQEQSHKDCQLRNSEIAEKDNIIETVENKLESEIKEKVSLQEKLFSLCDEKDSLLKDLNEKKDVIQSLQDELNQISKVIEDNRTVIKQLEDAVITKTKDFEDLKKDFNSETTKLATKLTEMEKSFKEFRSKSNTAIEKSELKIQKLCMEKEMLGKILQGEQEKLATVENEKALLIQQLNKENTQKNNFEREYLQKCAMHNNLTSQYSEEILKNKIEITRLSEIVQKMEKENIMKCSEIKTLEWNISQTLQNHKDVVLKSNDELKEMLSRVNELKTHNTELQNESEYKNQRIEVLQMENLQLQNTLKEEKISQEKIIKEKNSLIKNLEENIQSLLQQLDVLKHDHNNDKNVWEKEKMDLEEVIKQKEKQIHDGVATINSLIEERQKVIADMNMQSNNNIEIVNALNKEINELRKACDNNAQGNNELKDTLATEKAVRDSLESEKKNLLEENRILLQKTLDDQTAYEVLETERDSLLNEKAIMIQELLEEKAVSKLIDEEKERIIGEKKEIEDKLESVNDFNNTLLREKECLTQQLVDERFTKKILEQEKFNIADKKAELDEKLATEILNRMQLEKQLSKLVLDNENLSEEISVLKTMINALENEKSKLYQEVESFIVEKEDSHAQIVRLKQNVNELVALKDNLIHDKTETTQEKEILLNISNDMQQRLNEITSEKLTLEQQFEKISDKYSKDINNSEEEMKKITLEFKILKSDYKKLQSEREKITSILNSGLDDIMDKINNNININNILENIISETNDLESADKFNLIMGIINSLIDEVSLLKNKESELKREAESLREVERENKQSISNVEEDVENLLKSVNEYKMKIARQNQVLELKTADVQKLQNENQLLKNELNTLKIQLDEKVHSLKDKLIDNENLTDKLKETYECQIDNLNMMVTKLTNYLKDKTMELESARNEKDKLQETVDKNNKVIKALEDEIKSHKQIHEKIISEFESERLVLKNMVTVTDSVMEDQKASLNKVISAHLKTIDTLQEEITASKELVEVEKSNCLTKLKEKETAFETLFEDLIKVRKEKENLEIKLESEINCFHNKVTQLTVEKGTLHEQLEKYKKDVFCKEEENHALVFKLGAIETERDTLKKEFDELKTNKKDQDYLLQEKIQSHTVVINNVATLEKEITALKIEKEELSKQINALNVKVEANEQNNKEQIDTLIKTKSDLETILSKKCLDLTDTESRLQCALSEIKQLREAFDSEKLNLTNKCNILQEYQEKATEELDRREKEIDALQKNIEMLTRERDDAISLLNDKELEINDINKELTAEKRENERYLSEIQDLNSDVSDLRQRLDSAKQDLEVVHILRKENEELFQLVGQRETFAVNSQEKSSYRYPNQVEMELRHLHNQVDNTSTDTHTSMDSYKTITDLEMILQDKNRIVTSLQSDITYLKSLIAESENKLLDVTKDLELSKENCHQLSSQLKKIVHQKNEEIADLKKQVSKMSVTENRATQIIKLSARYQAMIFKRVAELKSNTILKELTNFGNSTNCDNDLRRNLNAGTITMEDLENFLETTDKHLKRCSERQIALQKERDRLSEVNRINESDVINMRKFLTELSVSIKTFNSVKELYSQKLSRVVSLQRTVRREILNLDGHITDNTMCKLERGYAAVMQDLSECAMNMERWVERCIGRTISSEKIKQAFTTELDRVSLASSSFQNASLEVQLEELENSFQRLLEEVSRARNGEGAKEAQSVTVMEVRAEYEDKLNRMKAKMKQLYQEQISIFKERQKEEIASLERELEETRTKLEESSRAYEKHIRSLTTELWNVGEKFLMKKDEAEWLRKTQRSGSLMSLQHVHSSGLVAPPEEPSRPSDSHSLRSLPVNNNTKGCKENRGVHMSDEEGEVFDNRWLKELASTPRREPEAPAAPGLRLSELRWRNSLCPPHLKSSYPAETQFAPALHEEDIKCMSMGGRAVRKEVGITAYKKPGPPTPSKQAGRLSATDSELRESLRVEVEPGASRKTSTPSRLRSLFRSNKNDTTDTTPRSRRLSSIFRKK